MSINKICTAVAIGAALFAGQAGAHTLLGQNPDPSVLVEADGLDWVWASPCAPGGCSNIQLSNGFGYATAAQWNASFTGLNDLLAKFTNANGSLKCGSTYFDVNFDHCDAVNIVDPNNQLGGAVWGAPFATSPASSYAETFLVRASAVPETDSVVLMLAGAAALAALARRRKA